MTPETPMLTELQTLLDALCEETITPEGLKRLEELILTHPEAERHYIRYMSFYADLIGTVAGLPGRTTVDPAGRPASEPAPPAAPVNTPSVASAADAATSTDVLKLPTTREDRPMRVERAASREQSSTSPKAPGVRSRTRWTVAAAVFLVACIPAAYQLAGWPRVSREVAEGQRALDAKREELARVDAAQKEAQQPSRKVLDDAIAAERELARQYQSDLQAALKAISERDFEVRLTGPARIQPGAPNRWQIETRRHGAVARPKRMEVVVKDAKDAVVFRETHDRPVGVATLDLPTSVWEQVKPGSDLFLEVNALTNDLKGSVERIPLSRPVYVTHLATDKPLYKPGETIRFRSLTLDRASLLPPARDMHLRFRLRDPGNAVIPLDEGNGRLLSGIQPILGPDGKPLRGIGVGEYQLPPGAAGGEYKLDLFEVESPGGKEVLLETRKFIVNQYVPDIFEKKLEFDGKSYGAGDVVQARIEVSRTAGGPMKDARAHVVASVDGQTFHELKGERFAIAADKVGTKAVLNVRFKLPADIFERAPQKNAPPNATLSVTVRDGSDAENILRPIPLVTKTLSVEFFPEGGEMVEGVPGRVYFQVRTPLGKPADLKGTITDGTATVAEIATLTDAENPGVNRGQGVFTLTPKAGAKYFLKVASPTGIIEPTKGGFPLPEAKPDGVALTALDAVTGKGAPIRLRLQVGPGAKTLHIGAYARGRLISQQKLDAQAGKPADVTLPGDDTAGGVTRVTVFEESKADGSARVNLIPRAERLVYRVPAEQLRLNVNPDQARYTPGGKVRLELSAVNEKNAPTPAVLLVGVVNQSVITMADNKADRLMPTHFLLSGEVKHPAELEHADFLLTDHPKAAAALDLLLGTQGWRRFAEQNGSSTDPADRQEVEQMLVAHGQRPSAPVELRKLEEQRMDAEFRPRLEQATLQVVSAEARWNEFRNASGAAVSSAQEAYRIADEQYREVKNKLSRYESRLAQFSVWPVLLSLVVLAATFIGRQVLALSLFVKVGLVCLVLVGVYVVVMNMESSEKSTFSFVGSAVKPPAAPAEERMADARADGPAAMAPQPAAPPDLDPRAGMKPNAALGRAAVPKPPVGLDKRGATQGDPGRRNGAAALGRERAPASPLFEKARAANALGRRAPMAAGADKAMWDSVIMAPQPPESMPFVVREYAHQRDPALNDVRSDFTETVYWHPVLVLPGTGRATVEFQLSDDIARYRVLVAGHTLDGRIGAITTTIEARKPFSVDPKLPPEISHTDAVDVPLRVTNDSGSQRTVALTTIASGLTLEGNSRDTIDLGPNGKGRKLLRLRPAGLQGEGLVRVDGASHADRDSIARAVRVVPDGFPFVGSFSDTIEARARGTIALPKDVVPGSLKVRLEVYPTSLSDLVKGLDGLLREPHGCFEQTSTTNYPNTLILNYLNQADRPNPETARRAKELLDRGYARLTSFECPDTPNKIRQGYEWFGSPDMAHEALTAYGLLQFKDMAHVHPVDPAMIRRTQNFLLSRKDGAGGFLRNRRALDGFGGAPKHTTDAYIVWALVESDPDDTERMDLRKEIDALKAEALKEDSTGGKDAYFVALTANVLLLRGEREAAHRLLDRLQERHMKGGAVTGGVTSITRSGGRDLEIETTALALLGWLRANDPKYAATVKGATKWVSQQRGGYGGFGATQSTIMALKALTLYATKSKHPAESGEFKVLVGGRLVGVRKFTQEDVEVIGLDVENPEAVFKPGEKSEVEVVTDAKQAYPFALSYTYTALTPVSGERCAVKIATKLGRNEATEGDTVPLSVTLENREKAGQGMAVAVIGLPAGMKVPTDMKQLTDLREKGQISFFETRGRELILYWRELAPEQKVTLTIDLVCDVPGTYRGPASRGYLYYNADHKHWVEPLTVRIAPMAGEKGGDPK